MLFMSNWNLAKLVRLPSSSGKEPDIWFPLKSLQEHKNGSWSGVSHECAQSICRLYASYISEHKEKSNDNIQKKKEKKKLAK